VCEGGPDALTLSSQMLEGGREDFVPLLELPDEIPLNGVLVRSVVHKVVVQAVVICFERHHSLLEVAEVVMDVVGVGTRTGVTPFRHGYRGK